MLNVEANSSLIKIDCSYNGLPALDITESIPEVLAGAVALDKVYNVKAYNENGQSPEVFGGVGSSNGGCNASFGYVALLSLVLLMRKR